MPKTYKIVKGRGLVPQRKNPGLSRTQAKTVRKIAKKTVMGLAETKHFGFQRENIQLVHNKALYLDNWLKCKQGVTDPNNMATTDGRIGDEILLTNMNIKLWVSNKSDCPNVMYRCIMFWYDTNYTLDDALCFFTQTNKMLDRPNKESISVIDQKYIFSGPSYAQTEHERSQLCTLNGSYKGHKVIYDEGGSLPKKRTIGLLVVAYDAFGTLQSDVIASVAYNGIASYKDL